MVTSPGQSICVWEYRRILTRLVCFSNLEFSRGNGLGKVIRPLCFVDRFAAIRAGRISATGNYRPANWVVVLAQIHKKQTSPLDLETRRMRQPISSRSSLNLPAIHPGKTIVILYRANSNRGFGGR